jgi:outer membrane protein assembly factor BamB
MIKNIIPSLALLSLCFSTLAGDWTNWRGPNYNGATTATGLPTKFSQTENITWKTALPGTSAATPIVSGNHVFLTAAQIEDAGSGKGRLLAMCLDRKSGKILWERNAGSGYRPNGDGADYRLDNRTNYASPSAVTDGEVVVFFFGNGDLVAYTVKGDLIWRRNIQKDYGNFTFQWTFAATPTLYEDKLYLPILQRDEQVKGRGKANNPSFILAMDPKSGKTLWKHVRASDANKESLESFGTIIPHNGELVIAGGDVLTGHDPETGKEHWRWGTWNPDHREQWWRLVPSPVAGNGVVLVCAPKRQPVYAITPGKNTKLVWKSEGQISGNKDVLTSDVCTPLFYDGKFFVVYGEGRDKTIAACEPKTGKILWTTNLQSRKLVRCSPTAADGKIYLQNHGGEVYVIEAKSGKILHRTQMGEGGDDQTRSSIAIAGKQLFIRTNGMIYCVGK